MNGFKTDIELAFLFPPAPADCSLVKTELTPINEIPVPPCVLEMLQPGWPHCSSARALLPSLLLGLKMDLVIAPLQCCCATLMSAFVTLCEEVALCPGPGVMRRWVLPFTVMIFSITSLVGVLKPCCPYSLHPRSRSPTGKVYVEDFQCKLVNDLGTCHCKSITTPES